MEASPLVVPRSLGGRTRGKAVVLADPTPSVLSWLGAVGLLAGEAAHGNTPVPIRAPMGALGGWRMAFQFLHGSLFVGFGVVWWFWGRFGASGCRWLLGLPPACPWVSFGWCVGLLRVAFAGLLACLLAFLPFGSLASITALQKTSPVP